jgi:hypothetical protein
MYLEPLKSAIVESLRRALDVAYVDADFTATWVGIEYPFDAAKYPGIWVTYDDRDTLKIASIDHTEYIVDHLGAIHKTTRWTFSGTVTLTIVAMSSWERDRLYDQIVRVFAFSRVEDAPTAFRDTIENNDFIGVNVDWDELRPGGDSAAPGTPWGTDDEVIYEKSLSFDVIGEFVSSPSQTTLVNLSSIQVMGVTEAPDGSAPNVRLPDLPAPPEPSVAFSPHAWH